MNGEPSAALVRQLRPAPAARRPASPRRRAVVAAVLGAALAGCSAPRPYEAPVDTPLQDPPPGQALVYLLRAPHDDLPLEVGMSGRKVAVLPPGTYTAVVAAPGRHVLATRVSTPFGAGSEAAPPLELDLAAGERRFLNVSGVTERTTGLSGFAVLRGSPAVPLADRRTGTARGTRSWKEVREIDAQGLMSISRPVMPE